MLLCAIQEDPQQDKPSNSCILAKRATVLSLDSVWDGEIRSEHCNGLKLSFLTSREIILAL